MVPRLPAQWGLSGRKTFGNSAGSGKAARRALSFGVGSGLHDPNVVGESHQPRTRLGEAAASSYSSSKQLAEAEAQRVAGLVEVALVQRDALRRRQFGGRLKAAELQSFRAESSLSSLPAHFQHSSEALAAPPASS